MPTVGSHQQAPVTIPVNGTSPVDADEVRLNDNAIITNYNAHDNDGTLHVQSSSLATRPLAGTAGRLWFVTDSSQLFYDNGVSWVTLKLDASSLTTGTVPTARVVGAYDNITSVGTLDDLTVTGPVTAGSFAGPLTGNVTGNVTGNADTATALSSARTVQLTGDVTGTTSTDLSAGATVSTSYTATVPVAKGGTGLTGTPTDGQLPIGNGTGYTLATLTAGNNMQVVNAAGSITLNVTGTASGVSGTGTNNTVPRWTGGGVTSQLQDSAITDNGTAIALTRSQLTLGSVNYTVPTVQGGASTALINNGSGVLSWATVSPADQTIVSSQFAPYQISASDIGKRLVINSATKAGVLLSSTPAIAVGSKVSLFCKTAECQIQVGTSYALTTTQPTITTGGGVVYATALQADGKLLIGGSFGTVNGVTRNNVARLNGDGSLDTGFNPNADNIVYAIAVQSDGKIVLGGAFGTVGGTTRLRMARVNADGTLDTGFNPNVNNTVFAVAVQSSGDVLLGGLFTTVGGTGRNYMARVTSAGALDTGYNPNMSQAVYSIALQGDGKAVVGGNFTTVGGTARAYGARINTDGTLDTGFANPSLSTTCQVVALQSDGKVLFGGSNYLVRYSTTGSSDGTFSTTVSGGAPYALAVQSDGNILVGGTFTTINSTGRNRIARVTSTGTLDTGYNPNADNEVRSVLLLSANSHVLGGGFTTIGGATFNRLAILSSAGGTSLTATDTLQTVFGNTGSLPQYAVVECEKTATTEWTITDINFVPTSVQTFDSSGTWFKPATGSMAFIEVWGAGGGGGNSNTVANITGGAGGGYMFRVMRLADLAASVSVTVGAGGSGAGAAIAQNGGSGGSSAFGSLLTVYGGAGGLSGSSSANFSSGGSPWVAGTQSLSMTNAFGTTFNDLFAMQGYNVTDRVFAGGAGTTDAYDGSRSRFSVYGGGGGATTTGTSVFGGNGGATGVNGVTPAGGGGRGNGTSSGVGGGIGGGGRVRITVW